MRTTRRNIAVIMIVLFVFALVVFVFIFGRDKLARQILNGEEEIIVENPAYQIDVLNGCGAEDVAFQVTQFLRMKGFDVIDYGNYGGIVEKSFVIDHVNKPDTARLIAQVLGIDEKRVVRSNENYVNEFTVVVGKDYLNLKPFKNKGEVNF